MTKSNPKPVAKGNNNGNRLRDKSFNVATYIGKIVLIAVAYFLAGKLGLLFSLFKGNITLIWPPSGIALAALLIFGWPVIPGVILGAFATTFSTGAPLAFALTTAIGNPLAALVPALLICHGRKFPCLRLDNTHAVSSLMFFGVLIGPLISATIGSMGILLSGMGAMTDLTAIWSGWWLGDAMGVLIFAPFFLVWSVHPTPELDRPRKFEAFAIFVLLMALEFFLLNGQVAFEPASQLAFLVFPLSVWAALRLDMRSVPTINLLATVIAVWGITHNFGSFVPANLSTSLVYLGTNSILTIASLFLASSIAERRAMQSKLGQLSTHDPLTGLYNRLYYDTEMERLGKSRQFPISIIMADADELKKVNDTLGHSKGDQALINVANLFTSIFRQEDIIARIGGDEFGVLLPATDAAVVIKIIERIHSQISVHNQKHPDLPINLSIGSATAQVGQSLTKTLNTADQIMYLDKRTKQQNGENHPLRQP